MQGLISDLKYTLRKLLNNPGSTILLVLVSGLGIGANTAIFSMVHGVLWRPLPYADGERLVLVHQQLPQAGVDEVPFSVKEFADYRDQNQSFESVVEYHDMWFTLLGGEEPQRVKAGVVSSSFFEVLGTEPILGRSFLPSDEKPGAEPVLILSHGYWQREYGGHTSILGRHFEMNDKIHTVVGVLPPVPQYPDENDVYMSTSACPFRSLPSVEANRNRRMLQVFGRLRPGVTLEQADADVRTIASRIYQEYPEIYADGDGYTATVVALREKLSGSARTPFLLLLATVTLVLLVTCANLANLTFARLLRREREFAIRTAMGEGRRRLIRQLLTESVVLAMLGAGLGLVLAYAGHDLLTSFAARFTPRADEIAIDEVVLLFALGISVSTGLVFGLIPALNVSGRVSSALREGGGRATTSRTMRRLRNGLITVELTLCFILLVGAGLMIRSFWSLQGVDAGFDDDRVLAVQLSLNWSHYTTPEERVAFYDRLLERARSLPGVIRASLAHRMPLDQQMRLFNGEFEIEGRMVEEGKARPRAGIHMVSPDYFETVGIPLLAGRPFDRRDRGNADAVAILSQSLARRHWGQEDPIGRRISLDRGEQWRTIIGVAGDAKHTSLEDEHTEGIYVAIHQMPLNQATLLAKTSGDPLRLARPVRESIYGIDPKQPVSSIETLEEMRRKSVASPRLTMVLLSLFAGLALLIASAGLGGVVAFTVSQETQEIGVRMALGASRREVLWVVLRRAFALVGVGLVSGGVAAFFLAGWMSDLISGISTRDLATFVGVALVLTVVTSVACLLPAYRALRVDPVTALRFE